MHVEDLHCYRKCFQRYFCRILQFQRFLTIYCMLFTSNEIFNNPSRSAFDEGLNAHNLILHTLLMLYNVYVWIENVWVIMDNLRNILYWWILLATYIDTPAYQVIYSEIYKTSFDNTKFVTIPASPLWYSGPATLLTIRLQRVVQKNFHYLIFQKGNEYGYYEYDRFLVRGSKIFENELIIP